MLMIVCLQTTGPHHPSIDVECYQQRHRTVPLVFELSTRNLSRTQWLSWRETLKRLNIGLLIDADHHFAPRMQPHYPLVAPQNPSSAGRKLLIKRGGLPVATAMGLQARLSQDPGDGRVMNGTDNSLLDDELLQGAAIPAIQMQSIGGWLRAGYMLNLNPFAAI